MDILLEKIELAKRLLDTNDQNIIDAVRSVFDEFNKVGDWGDLPDKVISDTEEAIRQIDSGMSISHEKAKATYQKWL